MQESSSVTLRYCLGCLVVAVLTQVVLSVPVFDRAVFALIGIDPLERLGNGLGIGQGKYNAALLVTVAAAALLAVLLAATLGRPGRRYRAAAFLLAVTGLASIPLWYQQARDDGFWRSIQRLDFVNLPTADPRIDAIFDRRQIPDSALTSFEAFAAYAEKRHAEIAGILARDWRLGSDEVRKAAFFAGLTGTLFAYGNKDHPEAEGCAANNELRAAPAATCLPAAEFLHSRIGCCDDYAHLMKYLLDDAQIPNRLVQITGHIFNEIDAAGRHYVVDANTGLVADRSWEAITTAQAGSFHVYLLPLAGLMDAAADNYRPLLGHLRGAMLRMMAQGGAPWTYHEQNSPCFPDPARQSPITAVPGDLPG